jgi:hypothetical protein
MVKLSTTKRVISQFQGRPIAEVKYIASLGSGDEPQIRQALGKPTLKDASARAQARLARQYVTLINSPRPEQIKHVKQITGKTLKPVPAQNVPNPNTAIMGNVKRTKKQRAQQGSQPKVKTQPQPHTPKKKWREVVLRPSAQTVPAQVQELEPACYRVLSAATEREYQVIIFCQLDNGQTSVVSSHVRPTSDAQGVSEAFAWLFFTPGGKAVYKGKKPIGIRSIIKVIMRFK